MNWHRMTAHIMQSDLGYRVYRGNGRYTAHRPCEVYKGAHVRIGEYASFADAAQACEEDAKR